MDREVCSECINFVDGPFCIEGYSVEEQDRLHNYHCKYYKKDKRRKIMGNTKKVDEFTSFATGAVRDTGGKGRMDLLPMSSLIRISKHMEDALTHYPERNWEKGLPLHTMIDSAMRHICKYMMGMDDEDHLCAAATNLLMALWTEDNKPEMNDIPTRKERQAETPSICKFAMANGDNGGVKFYVCSGAKDNPVCEYGGDSDKCQYKYSETV